MRGGNVISTFYAALLLLSAQAVAGGIRGHDGSGEGLRLLHQGSSSRELLQEEIDLTPSDGIFSTITPCRGLVAIITADPVPTTMLGNFTQKPRVEMLERCSQTSSVYLLDGSRIPGVLNLTTPPIKVLTIEPSDPIVWPAGTFYPHFAPGSINMIDCQNQIFDARNWPIDGPIEFATLIILRCHIVFPDMRSPWVKSSFLYDTSATFPCNGTNPMSLASDFPRSEARTSEDGSVTLGPGVIVQSRNYTSWCHTADNLEQLFREAAGQEGSEGGLDGLPAWAASAIGVAGFVVLATGALALWLYCGRPWCSCHPTSNPHAKQYSDADHYHAPLASAAPHSNQAATATDLAVALSSVLHAHRLRASSISHNTADVMVSATTTSDNKYFEPSHELRECPDCGQPHPAISNHPQRRKQSLLAHSDTHSGSASGSAGGRGTNAEVCTQCSAQLRTGFEHPRSIRESHSTDLQPPRKAHLQSTTKNTKMKRSAERVPGSGSEELVTRCTDAWVEDSLEARASISRGKRMVRGREASPDTRGHRSVPGPLSDTTGSISLAPPRRSHGYANPTAIGDRDRAMHAGIPPVHETRLSHAAERDGDGRRRKGPPSAPPSVQSQEFYDVEDAMFSTYGSIRSSVNSPRHQAHGTSGVSTPSIANATPSNTKAMHDSTLHAGGGTGFPWVPDHEPTDTDTGLHSPITGSPRSSGRLGYGGTSGGVHPGLKQYDSPPPSHPKLHRMSPRSSHANHRSLEGRVVDFGNDLEDDKMHMNMMYAPSSGSGGIGKYW